MDPAAALVMLGRLIIDDIQYGDGHIECAVAGGAGLHAAAGARLWWPKIAPVCGVGADLRQITRGILIEDGFVDDGLIVKAAQTVRSKLDYLPGGGRTETSQFGTKHFESMAVLPSEIPQSLLPAAGTYIFHGADPSFWSEILALRPQLGPVLWELLAPAPDDSIGFETALCCTDIVSLNIEEATAIFGAISPDAIIDRLLDCGAQLVVLRMGEDGALAADREQRLRVRPPLSLRVLDETGAGNSFCGGFLAGWCLHPGNLAHALRCATGSASCTLGRLGPARADDSSDARAFCLAASVEQTK